MTTALGQALTVHRAQHPDCDRHCPAYLDIARQHTTPRQIYAGPVAARTILSVKEST